MSTGSCATWENAVSESQTARAWLLWPQRRGLAGPTWGSSHLIMELKNQTWTFNRSVCAGQAAPDQHRPAQPERPGDHSEQPVHHHSGWVQTLLHSRELHQCTGCCCGSLFTSNSVILSSVLRWRVCVGSIPRSHWQHLQVTPPTAGGINPTTQSHSPMEHLAPSVMWVIVKFSATLCLLCVSAGFFYPIKIQWWCWWFWTTLILMTNNY